MACLAIHLGMPGCDLAMFAAAMMPIAQARATDVFGNRRTQARQGTRFATSSDTRTSWLSICRLSRAEALRSSRFARSSSTFTRL
jgi:hypothetical protein